MEIQNYQAIIVIKFKYCIPRGKKLQVPRPNAAQNHKNQEVKKEEGKTDQLFQNKGEDMKVKKKSKTLLKKKKKRQGPEGPLDLVI